MAAKIIPDSVRDVLNYNPDTGLFTWARHVSRKTRAGDVAGSKTNYGYIAIRLNGERYQAHRIAWFMSNGEQPDDIDHINHDRADNRLCNLRSVTRSQNLRNRGDSDGVSWWRHSTSGRVYARAVYAGPIYLGKSILLAHYHRIMAEREDHPIALTYRPCEEP